MTNLYQRWQKQRDRLLRNGLYWKNFQSITEERERIYSEWEYTKFNEDITDIIHAIQPEKLEGRINLRGKVMVAEGIETISDIRKRKNIRLSTTETTEVIKTLQLLKPHDYTFESWLFGTTYIKPLVHVELQNAGSKQRLHIRRYFYRADYWNGEKIGPLIKLDSLRLTYRMGQ